MGKGTDEQYRRAAEKYHNTDGELEADPDAVVSNGDDDGAYVQMWAWIPDSELEDIEDEPSKTT